MSKEFHIISSGVSLILNAQNKGLFSNLKISDDCTWQKVLEDPKSVTELTEFLKSNPMKECAELNTFLRAVKDKDLSNIEVYLFGTKTAVNELCRRAIENVLKHLGYRTYTPYEVSGYFWEANFDPSYATDEFTNGISELLDRLIHIAKRKKDEGYTVYFNATGGFKAHVIVTALAGFLTNGKIYYMNEEFQDIVFLPPLFYLPRGKEIELLRQLSDKKPLSGKEFEGIRAAYGSELERLEVYGIIQLEHDDFGRPFRVKITNKGGLLVKEIFS
ncbi:MAG: putative CRISPR-associated protein [Deltaproteobacteria bacterium]|nr:putative CRISPR-associated protein [Deltaproteobacteria bacterium]